MERPTKGINYMELALLAFGGLGIEALYAFMLEPFIYGSDMNEWNTIQIIIHWCITCITWILVAGYIIKKSAQKYSFFVFDKTGKISKYQWMMTVICVVWVLLFNWHNWGGIKCILELKKLGILKFIFQYIYYMVETAMFTLIIIFGQKACEVWFKNKNIPYGSIAVAFTWGIAHWFTKDSLYVGITTALCGACFGVVYLLMNRNIKWTYIILCIMFCL